MSVLSRILSFCLCLGVAQYEAAGSEESVGEPECKVVSPTDPSQFLCNSSQEYIATLKFLRANKDLIYPENTARLIAEKVATGCDGAAARFSKILLLLRAVGLSDRGALEMALKFASQSPEVQKNFSEIFSHAFLAEFFNYDYANAARLAYELSLDYHGDPVQVREDFLDLVRFCKGSKTLDLPTGVCAEITVKFARLSQYFRGGVRADFYKLFHRLREKNEFSMNVKTALDVVYRVLKSGPRAPENFLNGYAYATRKDGLALSQREAVAFAVRMADRSFIGQHPPIVLPKCTDPVITHAANP